MTCLYCDRPIKARKMCNLHWQRWYRGSKRLTAPPRGFGSGFANGWVHHGYRWICDEDANEVMEHRHRMERYLGRKLHTDECVHHKDGNKLNNDLSNLEGIARAQHTSLHRTHRTPCRICGKDDKHGTKGLCAKHHYQERLRAAR